MNRESKRGSTVARVTRSLALQLILFFFASGWLPAAAADRCVPMGDVSPSCTIGNMQCEPGPSGEPQCSYIKTCDNIRYFCVQEDYVEELPPPGDDEGDPSTGGGGGGGGGGSGGSGGSYDPPAGCYGDCGGGGGTVTLGPFTACEDDCEKKPE